MASDTDILSTISGIVWGPVMLVLLVGTGIYLTVGLKFMPLRRLGYGFRMLWSGRKTTDEQGDISPFNALMTALSATIGTGNIAGVATAIAIGGPGAVFWMWMTALVGMGTKYGEAVLAVKYREVDERGHYQGGPMYYIKNGLGKNWQWLGSLFALFAALAAFGIGNAIQANSVADAIEGNLAISREAIAAGLTILTALVIIGGVKWIAQVAGKLVPFMAIAYVVSALIILLSNISAVPDALVTIITEAFTGSAAAGGFIGSSVLFAIQKGVERGVFSNEAGLGSAPIAHAAAKTNDPVRQGTIAMLGTFIDTIIICTMTALVIVISQGWIQVDPESSKQLSGTLLTSYAFAQGLPDIGQYVVTFGVMLFAYTTLIGWSYYGERSAEYLFGVKVIPFYRILWIAVIPLGALYKEDLESLWELAGILNGFMAVPNLIALLLLSPVIFRITDKYFNKDNNQYGRD
ncbi:MAG: sodium:alanine symporter family protein [Gammaproteobacteria bacterium]|nr:MAG: sodium:alanine symporter family protein [Gammaproteobacteria bacterium]